RDWTQRARAVDSARMNPAEIFERDYLLSDLEEEQFWREEVKVYERNPLAWGYAAFPTVYLTREYAPLDVRMDAFNTYLENMPAYLADMRATIEGPLPRTWVENALMMYGGLDQFFGSAVSGIFAPVEDVERHERLDAAMSEARAALQETVAWLEGRERDESFALGPELFSRMLWVTERVDTPLAELKAIGEADMERNLQSMREACAEFAQGLSLVDCAAKSKLDKAPEGPVEGAKRQLHGLRDFLVKHDIVSIPSDDPVTVDAAPPYRASNLAYIEIPGPYEKKLPAVYYIAPPNPEWSEEEQRQYTPGETDLLYVSVHEVWPGHFLNYLHAKQADSIYGRISVGYAFAEGWAHYTEEMMHDAGLGAGDPQVHIGQLTNALLRNARYLSAIGLHTEGMTVEESQQLFIEKGLQDPGNAQQQAYRGTSDPGYLNYTMGKLMIMKLRDDWVASRGGRDAWKAFHDEFLSYGGPPIPMVREAMLGGAGGSLFATPAAETAAGEAEAL
ncbi:MAG: DUF885 domain-containing protein, partial [Proteobacteria bacterium]|nr:DUF885 domain-containing protein [Pseudomonadota bacterium]